MLTFSDKVSGARGWGPAGPVLRSEARCWEGKEGRNTIDKIIATNIQSVLKPAQIEKSAESSILGLNPNSDLNVWVGLWPQGIPALSHLIMIFNIITIKTHPFIDRVPSSCSPGWPPRLQFNPRVMNVFIMKCYHYLRQSKKPRQIGRESNRQRLDHAVAILCNLSCWN